MATERLGWYRENTNGAAYLTAPLVHSEEGGSVLLRSLYFTLGYKAIQQIRKD